ncbi:MAG: response regulator [Anaerolineae bacterium]|nr:response regulator [Anaerolineae bacterium]
MAEKILIVDDDIDSLKLIGLMLQRQGYDIVAANNGAQAFSKATSDRPDLIILDVMMPDMDGYEICRRLRANPVTQGIPIIMFTAKTLIDDKVAGFEAGADDYLTKPTHPAELASRVKAILSRSAAQRRTTGEGGTLTALVGVKGGVGVSTLAANVAAVLNLKEPSILADIRPGQGSLGMFLNMPKSVGMSNLLARNPNEITARLVEQELVAHTSGLRTLLSSARPQEMLTPVNADAASAVLKALRSMARHVIVDLGAGLARHTMRLVKEADQVVLVVEPYRYSLNMARDTLKEIESVGVGRGRISVVIVTRVASSSQVPWQEAEQILGHEMLGIIGPAPELAFQAIEAGFPIVLFQPASIATTQINKLTEELTARVRAVAS